mmetsp:Transcript_20934/g.31241  ORF Transcript_20934/g.31241 Transcript_20934/m.31241 type:complete len:318 (+) Transcript_20934:128-1081(+)
MKLNIKPLSGAQFELEIEETATVVQLKESIAAANPDLAAGSSKLVCNGKILADASTLQASNVADGGLIVVMMPKKTGATPAAAASSTPAPAAAPAPTPAPAPVPAAAAPAPAPGTVGGAPSPEAVQMLCEMGFPRSDVERALRAAFNNPDRAVDYLMGGIPPHLMPIAEGHAPPQPQPQAQPQQPMPQMPSPPQASGQQQNPFRGGLPNMPPMQLATGPLAKLQNHPMFISLKMAVQKNPGALNQVLSYIYKLDPSMVTLIAEHQEEFVEMLQESSSSSSGGAAAHDPVQSMIAMLQQAQAGGASGSQPGTGAGGGQ